MNVLLLGLFTSVNSGSLAESRGTSCDNLPQAGFNKKTAVDLVEDVEHRLIEILHLCVTRHEES